MDNLQIMLLVKTKYNLGMDDCYMSINIIAFFHCDVSLTSLLIWVILTIWKFYSYSRHMAIPVD